MESNQSIEGVESVLASYHQAWHVVTFEHKQAVGSPCYGHHKTQEARGRSAELSDIHYEPRHISQRSSTNLFQSTLI